MIGRHTAPLASHAARRAFLRVAGVPDVDTRQKWAAVWPVLRPLPRDGLRVLDAGCGSGSWALELAARRPAWHVHGVDLDEVAVTEARHAAARLGRHDVTFEATDMLAFRPPVPVDVVLSVLSAHYSFEAGRGPDLMAAMASWLAPGGRLVVLGPRAEPEAAFSDRLPRRPWHPVFRAGELEAVLRDAGLEVTSAGGRVGRLGAAAKQLRWMGGPVRHLTWPPAAAASALDRPGRTVAGPSVYWLVEAVAVPSRR